MLQEDISEWQTAMLLNEIKLSFKANLHCILLAPQEHTAGRSDCVPWAFSNYGGIKKQVNEMKRTEDGNVDNTPPFPLTGDSMCHKKPAGEAIESSGWAWEA